MKKRNIGYIVLFSIVVIACLWAFISAGVITRNFKSKMTQDDLDKKNVDIENLLVTETKDKEKLWEFFADSGHYDDKNNVVYLYSIIGNFYKDSKVVASFRSNQGTYNADKKEIVLYDNNLLVYKDGSNVRANRISWAGKEHDIMATGKIRIEKPNQVVVSGEKATLTSDLSRFKIYGRTRTEVYGEGKQL